MIQIDMEIPKTCGQCFCAMSDYDYNTVRCRLIYDLCFDANSRDYSNRRLDGCPLHEVTADPHWILCSKRLPEEDTDILVTYVDGEEARIIPVNYGRGTWFDCIFNSALDSLKVIAWMPLPEPYREVE